MIAFHFAQAAGALAALLFLLCGIFALAAWIATMKELVWAVLLNAKLTMRVSVVALTVSLVFSMSLLPNLPALVVAAFLTPILAWPALNLSAWFLATKGDFERTAADFVRDWTHAFEKQEKSRLRDAYAAPTIMDPDGQSDFDSPFGSTKA